MPQDAKTASPTAELSIDAVRAAVKGRVIAPGDADYDRARTVFYGGADRHPAVIVKVANAADVQAVVALARETGLDLAVRSGGHSGAWHSVCEGGIVIDLGDMKGLEIDVPGRTAWAETGLVAAELIVALGQHGLTVGFGDTGSVGIGGITLGGGVGFLVRKYGLTIDSLLAAEIVTADGQLLLADAEHNPDLFWAIRGGGGNFGVATRFKYRLQEVDMVLGGMLFQPATVETICKFIELAEAAPEELSTIANVVTAPPMPFLPPEIHGKPIIMSFIVYAGDIEAGQKAVAPFREIASPYADMLRPIHYPEMYPAEEGEYHPVGPSRTMFIDTVDPSIAETILKYLGASTAQMAVAQLRVLGGAMARVPAEATAFAHRGRRIMVNVAGLFPSVEAAEAGKPWVADFASAISQGAPDAYVNFLLDEGAERVRDAYPGRTWDRLAQVKKRYDPGNLFHMNQNIPPAA